ncbi:MAG: lipoyl synthase [Firmicutes bacterium]|nr:lipoyl synthase [Bacillota bacterium]
MNNTGYLPAPSWLIDLVRQSKAKNNHDIYNSTCNQLAERGLNTVCESARCPNRGSCFSRGTATFMILGNTCTRKCAFCAVDHGRPSSVDPTEPAKIKAAVEEMNLSHVVITSVTRDDLEDGGAGHFAAVIRELRTLEKPPTIEVLVPDFRGRFESLNILMDARPEVLAHNVETVPGLYPEVRPGADFIRSLELLSIADDMGMISKTGLMLGLGETRKEVITLFKDLRLVGVEMITIGQYLAPSLRHYPVQRYVEPNEFDELAAVARDMGFKGVASAPLVRSSYDAGSLYQEVLKQ